MLSKIFKQACSKPSWSTVSKQLFSKQRISKTETDSSIPEIVNHFIDKAAKYTKIPQDKMDFYKNCDGIVQINIPIKRENGTFEVVKSYRVQHKTHSLPTKGGIIINDQVTRQDVESFAVLNTVRSNTLDIPSGGAKGAICINPKNYTENELEVIVRKFTLEAAKKNLIGSSVDVLGIDLGSNEREMNWIKDTFITFFGQEDIHAIACVTGKGQNQGGLKGGQEAGGYGVYFALKYMLSKPDFCAKAGISGGLKGKTFVIEGYGSVGYWTAHFLQKAGATLVGICEHDGQIYNPKGIDAEDVHAYMKQHGGVSGYTQAVKQENVAFSPCDIFIPCYFAQSITKDNAAQFQCKVVAEGANLPTTPEAEKILESRGVQIIPDVLTSSGGFLASYFEWLKNINHTGHGSMTRKWEEKSNLQILEHIQDATGLRVQSQLLGPHVSELQGASERDLVISGIEETFESAFEEILETSQTLGVDMRTAAYVNSLNKLHGHYEQVGITFSK